MKPSPELRRQICDTLRMLAADAVQQANSGHPGTPMALADLAVVLWDEVLRFDPHDPHWAARDRFVLSCGHASMLQYGLLHLWGMGLSLQDLKDFRQWGSKTPGHPEVHHTAGVEVTTGPLGQGVANSVGMALAAKMLSARVDVPGDPFQVMSQRVFAICSDGDLMEGVSSEAASMAGHWRLDNLVWLYDDNKITIDGETDLSFSEDVGRRFEGFGWRVLRADGHDAAAVRAALQDATGGAGGPTLIICRTHIGFGSPNKVDTADAHGSPLGDTELALTKQQLGWPESPRFLVPEAVRDYFTVARQAKAAARRSWDEGFAAWRGRHPERAVLYDRLWRGDLPEDFWQALVAAAPAADATRKISGKVLQKAAELVPGLVGGSADLTGSNGVELKGAGLVGHPQASEKHAFSFAGRQLHFGIREHAMGAVTNGMLLHGGLRPFSGTFLVFSDYMRPAVRLAALSELPNIFVYSHDSVFLGEDGPTHQPIEHHWALRLIPGFTYFRPADGLEVAMTWAWALQHARGPVGIALTRQGVPAIQRPEGFDPRQVWRGAYVVREAAEPEAILVGTGSELHLCTGAADRLAKDGLRVRVVSMPSWELFQKQDATYRESVLPQAHQRVATVEAGVTAPWAAVTGRGGLHIGIDRFGASAPAEVLAEKLGLTADLVAARVRAWLDAGR